MISGRCIGRVARIDRGTGGLQVEVSDLAGMPEIGDAAASVIEAANAAAKARSFDIGIDGSAPAAEAAQAPVAGGSIEVASDATGSPR